MEHTVSYSIIVAVVSDVPTGCLLDYEYKTAAERSGDAIASKDTPEERVRAVWDAIDRIIGDICEEKGLDRVQVARFHFLIEGAGFGPGRFKSQLYEILKRKEIYEKTVIQSPEEAKLDAVVGSAPGIFVSCDVNTLVMGKGEGQRYEIALGWGPRIADHGSGERIGRKAIEHVLNALMKTNNPTDFEKAILHRCQAGGLQQLRDWALANEKKPAQWAALAEVVLEWVEKPKNQSQTARDILKREVGLLVGSVRGLQELIKLDKLRVCVAGNCFRHRFFRDQFSTMMEREAEVRESPTVEEASRILLRRNRLWGPTMLLQPIRNVVESPLVALCDDKESLVLGIYGATSRTGVVIGRGNGEVLYTVKGDHTLAYQAAPDVRSFQRVFDELFRRIYDYASALMSRVRHIQVCVSGAGAEGGIRAYRAAVKDSMQRYLANVDDLTVDAGADALGVLAAELLTPGKKFGEQSGIVVVSGSGSIIYQIAPGGTMDRQGGYGSPFTHDPGSSYDAGFHILEWLHEAIDVGGWKPAGIEDWTPSDLKVDPSVETFLSEVLAYFVKSALPWVDVETEKDPSAPLYKLRDYLRYLPSQCVNYRHRMKPVIAGITRLACQQCQGNEQALPVGLLKIKREVAGRLVAQVRRLVGRQRETIENYMTDNGAETYPILLEGGSFLCPVFSEAVVEGIETIGTDVGIVFDIRAPRFEPSLGAFALMCERREALIVTSDIHEGERYDPRKVIESGNKPAFKLTVPDLLERSQDACRSKQDKTPVR